jgi:hypothetical protein
MTDITRTRASASGLDEFSAETTSNPSSRITKEISPSISPGWSTDQRPRSKPAAQLPRFAVPDDGEEVIIKFLEEQPFAPIWQHWIMTAEGRRAYTCLGVTECPLCARGDRAKPADYFNIIVLGETPELKVWIASSDPSAAIKERANAKATSPINRPGLYFAVSKHKGSNGFPSYTVDRVREDELSIDWGVNSLTDEAVTAFDKQKFDGSVIRQHTKSELEEIARKFLTDD